MQKVQNKDTTPTIGNTLLADVAGRKVFKIDEVRLLLKEITRNKISLSKAVEKMNEKVDDWYSGQALRPIVKMDIVRYLDAYLKEFKMSEDLEKSIKQTLELLKRSVVICAESNFR